MCDPPRIYPSFSEYTPLFNKGICMTLPESTPPSQYIPPFQQMYVCDPPRIYPSQNIPSIFNKCICVTLPDSTPPPRVYPHFQQMYMWDPPRIYPSHPDYIPLFNKCRCVTLQKSTPPSWNTPPFTTTECDLLRMYPSEGGVDSGRVTHIHLLKKRVYSATEAEILERSHI